MRDFKSDLLLKGLTTEFLLHYNVVRSVGDDGDVGIAIRVLIAREVSELVQDLPGIVLRNLVQFLDTDLVSNVIAPGSNPPYVNLDRHLIRGFVFSKPHPTAGQ